MGAIESWWSLLVKTIFATECIIWYYSVELNMFAGIATFENAAKPSLLTQVDPCHKSPLDQWNGASDFPRAGEDYRKNMISFSDLVNSRETHQSRPNHRFFSLKWSNSTLFHYTKLDLSQRQAVRFRYPIPVLYAPECALSNGAIGSDRRRIKTLRRSA